MSSSRNIVIAVSRGIPYAAASQRVHVSLEHLDGLGEFSEVEVGLAQPIIGQGLEREVRD